MSLTYALSKPISTNASDYKRLKKTLKNSTAGYGSALSASYFITQGADQGVSAMLGAVTSYAYVSLLSDRVDKLEKSTIQKEFFAPLSAATFEVDTSILILRRLFKKSVSLDLLYRISNLIIRVFYETMMLLFVAQLFREEPLLFRMHMVGSQMFITIFSYGICAMTFSKPPRKMIKAD